MSGANKFVAGCTAGVAISLVAVCLRSARRKRASAAREAPLIQPERPPHGGRRAKDIAAAEDKGAEIARTGCVRVAYRWPRFVVWMAASGAVLVFAAVFFSISLWTRIKQFDAQLAHMSDGRPPELPVSVKADGPAWVGLVDAIPQPLTSNGGGFTIKLQNTGETPAFDLEISGAVALEGADQKGHVAEPSVGDTTFAGILMPGAMYATDVRFQTSPDAVSRLAHDQLRAVNFVRLAYRDVFHSLHVSRACFYWRPGLASVKSCDGDNPAN